MRSRPTERIRSLLQEIGALRRWAGIALEQYPDLEPIPSSHASDWERGFRHSRGGQISFDEQMLAMRRSRLRQQEGHQVRGRKEFSSLTPEQILEIEREIEKGQEP